MERIARRAKIWSTCLALALAACPASQPDEPTQAQSGQRVENPALGIALTGLPEGFVLAVNQGERLELARADADDPGRVTLEVGPVESAGINLVAAIQAQKEAFLAQPEGEFFGQIELGTHFGPAFTTRGRYARGGERLEEFRVFAIHPLENRRLMVSYRYPAADDTAARRDQLLTLLAEIEGLARTEETGAP